MRIIEEAKLKDYIKKFKSFTTEYNTPELFYENIHEISDVSLQSFSYDQDMEFFDESSFVLNVIISIISHPHISNKREEIIIRADQAPNISVDAFQRVLQDSTLWKESDLEMKPEYVYHYQYEDEIKIYENQFIVLLINMLDDELKKYLEFYVSLIPSLGSVNSLSYDNELSEKAILKLEGLKRKIRYIKNTYFYKEVSRGLKISKNIKPTNILTKDRKYKYCFKFYRKFITYLDEAVLINDYRNYCFVNLVKIMKNRGYHLVSNDKNVVGIKKMKLVFENELFRLEFAYADMALSLKVTSFKSKRINASHALLFTGSFNEEANKRLVRVDKKLTTEAISIWHLASVQDNVVVYKNNPMNETELIASWLDSKIYVTDASEELYSRYCPVCKGKTVEQNNSKIYVCHFCDSTYAFVDKKHKKLWLQNARRD